MHMVDYRLAGDAYLNTIIATVILFVNKSLPVAHYITCETHGEAFQDHWLQSDGVFPQPQQTSLRAPTRAQAERVRRAPISYFSSH